LGKLARKELIGGRKHWMSPVMSSRKLEERVRDNDRQHAMKNAKSKARQVQRRVLEMKELIDFR
jgi:hypothetical protein